MLALPVNVGAYSFNAQNCSLTRVLSWYPAGRLRTRRPARTEVQSPGLTEPILNKSFFEC
jgi:hypothetical protein